MERDMIAKTLNQRSALGWALLLPCLLFASAITLLGVWMQGMSSEIAASIHGFRAFALVDCHPDSRKLLGYSIAVAVILVFYAVSFGFIKRWDKHQKNLIYLGF